MEQSLKYLLPKEVSIVPLSDFDAEIRDYLQGDDGDFVLTRPRSRSPSRLIDQDAAEFLEFFREPISVVGAVIMHGKKAEKDPATLLEEVFPLVKNLVNARYLVSEDDTDEIVRSFENGELIGPYEVVSCLQALEDAEVYKVKTEDGDLAALKFMRKNLSRGASRLEHLKNEALVLEKLDGSIAPRLLASDFDRETPYLVLDWVEGLPLTKAKRQWLNLSWKQRVERVVPLATKLVETYADLHNRGVLHGDLHPGNVMLTGEGDFVLVDFGLACLIDPPKGYHRPLRGALGHYYEPEYSQARQKNVRRPKVTNASEQYLIGAIFYWMVTGHHYCEFSLDKDEMHRQIAEEPPRSFEDVGLPKWPALESVLQRAMSKDPTARFDDLDAFADALKNLGAAPDDIPVPILKPATKPTAKRELSEDLKARLDTYVCDTRDQLLTDGLLFKNWHFAEPSCSVNYGAAGVAYAFYRWACLEGNSRWLSEADLWCQRAIEQSDALNAHGFEASGYYSEEFGLSAKTVGAMSIYHSPSGLFLIQGLIASVMGDFVTANEAVYEFVRTAQREPSGFDLTLGEASALVGGTLLLEALPETNLINKAPLLEMLDQKAAILTEQMVAAEEISHSNELSNMLGIAHGWGGFVFALLRYCQATGKAVPEHVLGRLDELAELGQHDQNGMRWPRKLRDPKRSKKNDFMNSWCNGASGLVSLWTLAYEMTGNETYLSCAQQAGLHSFADENRFGSLCCGMAGRVYGMLNLYRTSRNKDWADKAETLAGYILTSPEKMLISHSLYKGKVGMALALSDLMQPEKSAFPMFESEGYSGSFAVHF